MAKIHLRANKLNGTNRAFAVCASKQVGNGKVNFNSRSTYKYMASEIVDFETLRGVSKADRCAHCMDIGLQRLNVRRRNEGLEPVTSIFKNER